MPTMTGLKQIGQKTRHPYSVLKSANIIHFIFFVVLISGCGGGGGEGDQAPASGFAPTATDSNLSVMEDTIGNGILQADDPDSASLSYSIINNGSKGTATITDPSTGSYSYTPDNDEVGDDNFTFKASDGKNESNVASVAVTISPVNDVPIAQPGCSTTPQENTLSGVFLTATDSDDTDLTFSVASQASKGVVTIIDEKTGEFTYQPSSSAGRGIDTFVYQVEDPNGGSDTVEETVIVAPKIMPLGDSITSGFIDSLSRSLWVGYRKPLYDKLITAGFSDSKDPSVPNFDFVGSAIDSSSGQPFGSGVSPFDPDNEGHGGWSAEELVQGKASQSSAGKLSDWLDQTPVDYVLLHIGTNDFSSTTVQDITDILDEIRNWEASNGVSEPATILVARIVDRDDDTPGNAVENFNQAVANMVASRGDSKIFMVDHHSAVPYPIAFSDTIHPNTAGYTAMADKWLESVAGLLPKCP